MSKKLKMLAVQAQGRQVKKNTKQLCFSANTTKKSQTSQTVFSQAKSL